MHAMRKEGFMKKFLIVAFSLFAALSLFADVTATAVKGVVGVLADRKSVV